VNDSLCGAERDRTVGLLNAIGLEASAVGKPEESAALLSRTCAGAGQGRATGLPAKARRLGAYLVLAWCWGSGSCCERCFRRAWLRGFASGARSHSAWGTLRRPPKSWGEARRTATKRTGAGSPVAAP
jgi:hypothetical protein